MEELTEMFTTIPRHGEIPQEWKTSTTTPMFKKGDKNKPENYRVIALLNITQKLLTKVVLDKLRPQLEILKNN